MNYSRMPIELESPEQLGYDTIRYNLSESSVADRRLGELKLKLDDVLLCYGDHRGAPDLRALVARQSLPGYVLGIERMPDNGMELLTFRPVPQTARG